MAGRFKIAGVGLAILMVASACGANEPKFDDAWVQKNWPESGRAYASFKVQGNMAGWGEGCTLHSDSPYDFVDLYSQDPNGEIGVYSRNPYDDCSKTASIKKWYIRDGYLVGTFRCSIKVVVDGQEKHIVGEVAQEVFADESPVEPGGWRNRGNCKIALFDADATAPVGMYSDNSFPDQKDEDIKAGKAVEIYAD